MKQKLIFIFLISLIFSSLFARQQITNEADIWCSLGSCASTPQSDNIQINIPDGGNIPPGSWVNNQIQIMPNGGNGDGRFIYSSNDESVCTVDAEGNVTRISLGVCNINIIKEADLEFSEQTTLATFNIECTEQPALALVSNGNWSNQNTRQIHIGGGAGNGQVTWTTNNANICSISNNGLLTRHATGLCNLTAIKSADNDSFVCSAQESINFNIECTEQPALALVSNGNWSNQNTRQIHIGGGAGNGQVTWTTNNANICSISNNGLLTQHATGSCNVTATKAADNESFVCSAQGSINFSTAVYSTLDIRNGYTCPAGFTLPTKAQFLEAYNKHLAPPDRWQNKSVWYYKNNGSKVWLNVADGHWYYNKMNMKSNESPSLGTALNWNWNNTPKTCCFSGGTVKILCIK